MEGKMDAEGNTDVELEKKHLNGGSVVVKAANLENKCLVQRPRRLVKVRRERRLAP